MADIVNDKPAVASRKRRSSTPILLPPLLFLGAMIMAADITAVSLAPLRVLQITYPRWIDYSPFLIPGTCAIVWLASLRKWPTMGAIISVLLCFVLLAMLLPYVESQVVRVPVTRWINPVELKAIEAAVGVPVTEQASREGPFVIVAPSGELQVRAELARLNLLDGRAAK